MKVCVASPRNAIRARRIRALSLEGCVARKFLLSSSSIVAIGVGCAMLMQVSEAEAARTPNAPVNNTTVTCTGTANNQNGTAGYGTGGESGLVITVGSAVQPDTSVTGTDSGFRLDSGRRRQSRGAPYTYFLSSKLAALRGQHGAGRTQARNAQCRRCVGIASSRSGQIR